PFTRGHSDRRSVNRRKELRAGYKTSMKKWIALFAPSFVIGFYTTFVMQSLWNWFVAPTFHIVPISYWAMFGIQLLLSFVLDRAGDQQNKWNWKAGFILMNACVPDERRHQV